MINVVIPLGTGSKNKDIELRYTLRGIRQHLLNYKDIYIVGECPKWLTNVIHLPYLEYEIGAKHKETNIFNKLLYACKFIDDNRFMYMNDDHFLISELNADNMSPYYNMTLEQLLSKRRERDPYYKVIQNTIDLIGDDKFNYDIHCPMIMYHDALMSLKNIWKADYGYLLKTLHRYATPDFVDGWQCEDLKFRDAARYEDIVGRLKSRWFFSVADAAMDSEMLRVLDQLYPSKSIYEQ